MSRLLPMLIAVPCVLSSYSVFSQTKPKPPSAQAPVSQSLGAVRPSNLVLPQFGVSVFDGSDGPAIGATVQKNMALADIAMKPANASAATAAAKQDQSAPGVNYDAWAAAGVNYVLRGQAQGGTGQAELYDIASRQRILGKQYSGAGTSTQLAHKIADDVMTGIAGMPGIFTSRICFLNDRPGGAKEVVVMDADGGNARQLTNERALVSAPCWGMNGTEVYYTSYRDNNPDLYGITLAGQVFEVSRRPGLNTAASWNGATQRLALSLSKDGNSEIYTMSRDGRDPARLTNIPGADTAPEWSPDGSQIAFTSDRDGRPGIYIMGSGGGAASPIATGGYFDSPTWSPDGSRIAYVARESGEFNIYVVNARGGTPAVQLTRGARDNTDPSWGPSSRHLVFSSNRGGSRQIYMMNVDTKRAHQVSRTAGPCTSPSWGPALK